MMTRRGFLSTGAAGLLLAGCTPGMQAPIFPVTRTDADWKQRLTPDQYQVLRHDATERAYTSPLLAEKRRGTFVCVGCDQPLFSSDTKYDSQTGWPSFWAPLAGGVGTKEDTSEAPARTDVYCARCGGHLGHVFPDGPQPTGQRYCMNGLVLGFRPATA